MSRGVEPAIPVPSDPVGTTNTPSTSGRRATGLGPLARALVRHARPYRGLVALVLVAMGVDVAASVGARVGFRFVIDDALGHRDGARLVRAIVALACAALAGSAAGVAQDYLAARLETSILRDVRQRLFDHLQRLAVAYFARSQVGDLVARFAGDLESVENALYVCLWSGGLVATLTLLVAIPPLFWLDARLAGLALGGLPLVVLGCLRLAPPAASAYYEARVAAGAVLSKVQENAGAQPTVKAFGLERAEGAELARRLDRQFRHALRSNFLGYLAFRIPDGVSQLISTAVLALGAWFVLHGSLGVGALVAFYVTYAQVLRATRDLTSGMPMLLQSAAGMQRIDQVLAEVPGVRDAPGAPALPPFAHTLAFENVALAYGDAHALDGLDLTVAHGSMVALVGTSGAGKTSALGLLLRLNDPTRGVVRVDGRDVREVSLASLRGQIGAVLQDAFLFDTTVRENIRLGRAGASDADVERAARDAEVHDAVLALPRGYDTPVGERGVALSGGQRQRVALARALVREPGVLLLDEATSALDAGTEAAILATLRRLAHGRTVIAATHRLQAARLADRIVVLEHGRVVEDGTHAELLARGGRYRALWDAQATATSAPAEAHAPPATAAIEAAR